MDTPEMPNVQEPKPVKFVLTLGLAGFFSGLVLVGAYLYTLPLIEANKARAMEQAIYRVLPGCTAYKTMALQNGALRVQEGLAGTVIFAGYAAAGELIGFAIPAQEIGFQDVIAGLIGYDPVQKKVVGFEVLESKETPGLGDKIFKDADFKSNFQELECASGVIIVSKGKKSKANEVEAITGATISSKAVVRIINKGLDQWRAPVESWLRTQTQKQ